jgi:tRNA(fMet)-specific endonuclease VapC
MDRTLLDTDILSEVLKQRDQAVVANAAAYLALHGSFSFSEFTRFEVRRGLLHRQATVQLHRFEVICSHSVILPTDALVFDRAAELWAEAKRHGHPSGDADIIIAATALVHDLKLSTGNLPHFNWITALRLSDWRIANP